MVTATPPAAGPTVTVAPWEVLLGLASGLVTVAVTAAAPGVLPVAVTVNVAVWPAPRPPTLKEAALLGVRPGGRVTATVELSAGRVLPLVLVTWTVRSEERRVGKEC